MRGRGQARSRRPGSGQTIGPASAPPPKGEGAGRREPPPDRHQQEPPGGFARALLSIRGPEARVKGSSPRTRASWPHSLPSSDCRLPRTRLQFGRPNLGMGRTMGRCGPQALVAFLTAQPRRRSSVARPQPPTSAERSSPYLVRANDPDANNRGDADRCNGPMGERGPSRLCGHDPRSEGRRRETSLLRAGYAGALGPVAGRADGSLATRAGLAPRPR
jgi:hypothetical protein